MSSLSRLSSHQVDEEVKKYNKKINDTGFSMYGSIDENSLYNITAPKPYDKTTKLLPTREQFMMPSNKLNTLSKIDSGLSIISSVFTGNANHHSESEYREYLAKKANKDYTFDKDDYKRTFVTKSYHGSSQTQERDESLVSAPTGVSVEAIEKKYLKYKTKYLILKRENSVK